MWHWISSIADKRWFMFTPHWNPSRWNKKKNFTDEQNVNRLRQGRQIHCILKAQDGDMMNILRSLGHILTLNSNDLSSICVKVYVNSWRTPRKVLVLQYWEICVICWPSLKQLPCNCLCNVLNDLTVKDLL